MKANKKEIVNLDVIECAHYIIEHKCTIRTAAKHFNVTKSRLHRHLRDRLMCQDFDLYLEVSNILDFNKRTKHIRGGEATKLKWRQIKNERQES